MYKYLLLLSLSIYAVAARTLISLLFVFFQFFNGSFYRWKYDSLLKGLHVYERFSR